MPTRISLGVLAWLLTLGVAHVSAQEASEPASPASPQLAGYDHGFVLRSTDGSYSLRIMGLAQLRYARDQAQDGPATSAVTVSRARVGLVGSLFTRDLRYMLVAELAGASARLLFLTVDYTLVPGWLTVRAGQFKRPFSRPFITMASQLSMIDRPLTVGPSAFGDDVDVGVVLHNGSSGRFEYSVGVFSGTASGARPNRVDPLVSVRVGYNTPGLDGYSESDLDGGDPRIGIAAAALADFDADGDRESFSSGVVDVLLKAYGFSLSSAFYVGARQDGARWSDQQLSAIGHYTQMGYVFGRRFEPVLRYAFLMPSQAGGDQHDVAGGVNVFLRGHALKLQTFVGARFREGRAGGELSMASQLSVSL